MGKEKVNINIVVIDHVGSDKSTTIGHLIYKLGGIDKHVIERLEEGAAKSGINNARELDKQLKAKRESGINNARELDKQLKAKRESGISIDNGMWELETDKYHFTFIDAHRHPESIKNMIRGASGPDCALFVVDSTSTGGFDVGIFRNGQTPEHALIKPRNVICCCNKMDAANYSKERYDEIVKSTSPDLKKLGYYPAQIPFVPISDLEGDNLIERSNNLPWYEGPTLLEALDQIQVPNGGTSIKSAFMKRGKKFGAAMVCGGKTSWAALVKGGQKSWAAVVKGGKKFGPPCINATAVGAVHVAVALAS